MTTYRARLDALGARPVDGRGAPISAAFLQALEGALGAALPGDYAAFLAALATTSLLEYDVSLRTEDGEETVVELFFGADPTGCYDLINNYQAYLGRVPAGLLPIAEDPYGNLVCLGIHPPYRDEVFFWNHEQEGGAGGPTVGPLHRIADTFDAFLSRLVVEDEDAG